MLHFFQFSAVLAKELNKESIYDQDVYAHSKYIRECFHHFILKVSKQEG